MKMLSSYFERCSGDEPGAQRYLTEWYRWKYPGALTDLLNEAAEFDPDEIESLREQIKELEEAQSD